MSESIYSWIKEEPAARPKPERYRSVHDPAAPVPGSTLRVAKKPAATIGRIVKDTVSPGEFLRSREKSAELPEGT